MRAIAGSDGDAVLADLYDRYWADLVTYVNRMLNDPQQAEDVAQETMLRAWRHAADLRPERGSVRGWLYRVARNVMIDKIRHKRARPTEVRDTAAVPHQSQAVADHAPEVVEAVFVARAIAQLQPAHRAVLNLVYYQDRSCAEAAVLLGVPVGTVKSRLHYALRHLRNVLAEQGDAAPAGAGSVPSARADSAVTTQTQDPAAEPGPRPAATVRTGRFAAPADALGS